MSTENEDRTPAFNFPILMSLTALACLVSFQACGVNTAIGVATGTALLGLFIVKRNSKSTAAE
jgi:hypothetical protein